MMNRRRFVYGMFSVGILGLGSLDRGLAAQGTSLPSLQGRLSRDVFLALRHQTFTAMVGRRRVPLVLVNVSDDGSDLHRAQFTVVFQGPREVQLEDGVYILSHPTAGMTPLYVQPGGTDNRSSYYNAPFNLLS